MFRYSYAVDSALGGRAVCLAAADAVHLPHLLLCALLLYQAWSQATTTTSAVSALLHRCLHRSVVVSLV